ncbi:N-acetyl-gamma-glutamyl-phosphate reductase [wastewater metagenome]|uniref:N-acetyl-gamma-glutamyl-phosphate reductase n=3 Tax=root TaxID=1 RepID=A0A5B8RAF4_9ZZZZ|nr:N-acetyl-gamma-glutamyl-phosphate reductase [Arhodomonas aquaeolei]MCS4504213.1 N-acetyl-gamma-glutamyl-phosphate reductase [Arhodomonas aquaeolei]QEA04928.1 N-acetyl-gamma-glutamyl-phosphate reductase [uncultured organism]
MLKVGIVGGTGYTGVELLRLLAHHPHARAEVITSRGEAGRGVAELFPNLRGHCDLAFEAPDDERLAACDVVFFATPNGTAMQSVPALLEAGVRVIDLGADFRIRDLDLWSEWYGMTHACPGIAAEAVYGLPERHRDAIRGARLVANPGCYPTAVQLGFLPLVEAGLVDTDTLVADAKSGATGAGRQPRQHTLLGEASENFRAYGASGHRHLPEIRQGLMEAAGGEVGLVFMPHLAPMVRGIHASLYARLRDPATDLQALFEARYADEPFVDVLPAGSHPETRSVRGVNTCRIAVHRQPYSDMALVLAVEDNLVKGAAGQAVQNMNLMFDLPETAGLGDVALLP